MDIPQRLKAKGSRSYPAHGGNNPPQRLLPRRKAGFLPGWGSGPEDGQPRGSMVSLQVWEAGLRMGPIRKRGLNPGLKVSNPPLQAHEGPTISSRLLPGGKAGFPCQAGEAGLRMDTKEAQGQRIPILSAMDLLPGGGRFSAGGGGPARLKGKDPGILLRPGHGPILLNGCFPGGRQGFLAAGEGKGSDGRLKPKDPDLSAHGGNNPPQAASLEEGRFPGQAGKRVLRMDPSQSFKGRPQDPGILLKAWREHSYSRLLPEEGQRCLQLGKGLAPPADGPYQRGSRPKDHDPIQPMESTILLKGCFPGGSPMEEQFLLSRSTSPEEGKVSAVAEGRACGWTHHRGSRPKDPDPNPAHGGKNNLLRGYFPEEGRFPARLGKRAQEDVPTTEASRPKIPILSRQIKEETILSSGGYPLKPRRKAGFLPGWGSGPEDGPTQRLKERSRSGGHPPDFLLASPWRKQSSSSPEGYFPGGRGYFPGGRQVSCQAGLRIDGPEDGPPSEAQKAKIPILSRAGHGGQSSPGSGLPGSPEEGRFPARRGKRPEDGPTTEVKAKGSRSSPAHGGNNPPQSYFPGGRPVSSQARGGWGSGGPDYGPTTEAQVKGIPISPIQPMEGNNPPQRLRLSPPGKAGFPPGWGSVGLRMDRHHRGSGSKGSRSSPAHGGNNPPQRLLPRRKNNE
ncbi:mucin-19-like [Macrobrachium nipponense]|uniref:mucin-19-like n=1 Tax=Macrobrachium nipponense TaxID=159736 RepID=UPI0030C8601E